MSDRRLVILESPYSGDKETMRKNKTYARKCIRDSLERGEAPIASHLLYTQTGILNDAVESERAWGIDAGLAWVEVADASVFYTDLGMSDGMVEGVKAATEAQISIEFRTLKRKK